LYAADFRANKIVVWNKDFGEENWGFNDPAIPSGFAPFNIQSVGEWLYVTYAMVGEDGDEEAGDGLEYVSIFKPNGEFVSRFASRGHSTLPGELRRRPLLSLRTLKMEWTMQIPSMALMLKISVSSLSAILVMDILMPIPKKDFSSVL